MVAKARNMPEMVETQLAQMAVLFVSYSMVSTGLLTVFIWDTLVFDKRDSMVLGPLPIRGRTVVAAKLAALATFLMGIALVVNLTSGLPFAFVTGATEGLLLRHLAGHLSGTIGGAVFVFSALVVVRGLLVILVSPHFAATIGSLLQFVFLSGVLVLHDDTHGDGAVVGADRLVLRSFRAHTRLSPRRASMRSPRALS